MCEVTRMVINKTLSSVLFFVQILVVTFTLSCIFLITFFYTFFVSLIFPYFIIKRIFQFATCLNG